MTDDESRRLGLYLWVLFYRSKCTKASLGEHDETEMNFDFPSNCIWSLVLDLLRRARVDLHHHMLPMTDT